MGQLIHFSAIYTDTIHIIVTVDKLPKCRSWDHDCQRKVIELFIQNIGSTGISDLDNIRIDPYDITGVQISVFDLIDVGITEGNVTGIKECTVSKFV